MLLFESVLLKISLSVQPTIVYVEMNELNKAVI